ncbi:hypothetical protein BSL78_01097 [Apostichopus japonicus]|uniref:Uncharacterized protein n=1 Tax=Stichopus japonicus TaxID=307972 RepID=A0A2G8LNZ1_STIJA|nr:hypothetical protein BSL78_01097 [Apostichopus japonicus]
MASSYNCILSALILFIEQKWMASKRTTSRSNKEEEREGSLTPSIWKRALTAKSSWPEKDEFLDVIYWTRQVIGILLGIVWGIVPLKGFIGLALWFGLSYTLHSILIDVKKLRTDSKPNKH